jgi:hypothetical protein
MSHRKITHEQSGLGIRRRRGLTIGLAATAVSLVLGAGMAGVALDSAGAANHSSPTTVIHWYQKETSQTFYNASNQVIQSYPPVGGLFTEDDIDYVGDNAHHAKASTVTDHQVCLIITASANADCFITFASGDSLIYSDDIKINLAHSANNESDHIDGGTGIYVGDSGTLSSTSIGSGNNSDLVLTLHKG